MYCVQMFVLPEVVVLVLRALCCNRTEKILKAINCVDAVFGVQLSV